LSIHSQLQPDDQPERATVADISEDDSSPPAGEFYANINMASNLSYESRNEISANQFNVTRVACIPTSKVAMGDDLEQTTNIDQHQINANLELTQFASSVSIHWHLYL
jgi:hypothetical protein